MKNILKLLIVIIFLLIGCTEMRRLANGTIAKLERMTDADFDGQRVDFVGE